MPFKHRVAGSSPARLTIPPFKSTDTLSREVLRRPSDHLLQANFVRLNSISSTRRIARKHGEFWQSLPNVVISCQEEQKRPAIPEDCSAGVRLIDSHQ